MAKLLLLLLLLVTAVTSGYAAAVVPERNTITHIKGFDGPLPFSLETGYVEVEETHGVELFYYFIQSERNPQEDPLILWISGGPGCSGLNALFFDIGPLKLDVAGCSEGLFPRLVYFEDSWTKVWRVILSYLRNWKVPFKDHVWKIVDLFMDHLGSKIKAPLRLPQN